MYPLSTFETVAHTSDARLQRIPITLPVEAATLELPPALHETLTLILAADRNGISSLELRERCDKSVSVPNNLSRLKELGICIGSERRPVIYRDRKRNGIAHYTYEGFIPTAQSIMLLTRKGH